jgi:hypothetical protein
MESNNFWAFFIIALIAGASIAFAVSSNAMTGYFTLPFNLGQPTATQEVAIGGTLATPVVITPIKSTTAEGTKILSGATEFNNKLSQYGLDDKKLYGNLGKWNTAFADIYVVCKESYKDKFTTNEELYTFCSSSTLAAWLSAINENKQSMDYVLMQYKPGTPQYNAAAQAADSTATDGGGTSTEENVKVCKCPDGSTWGCSPCTCKCTAKAGGGYTDCHCP